MFLRTWMISISCCCCAHTAVEASPKARSARKSVLFTVGFLWLLLHARILCGCYLSRQFRIHRFRPAERGFHGNIVLLAEVVHEWIGSRQVMRHHAVGTIDLFDDSTR